MTLTSAHVTAFPSPFPRLRSRWARLLARVCRFASRLFNIRACSNEITLTFDPYWSVFTGQMRPGMYRVTAKVDGDRFEPQTRRLTVTAKHGVDATLVLAPKDAPCYYRRDVKVPFQHHDIVAVALRPGHWDEDYVRLVAADGDALDKLKFERISDIQPARSQGVQRFRVAPRDRRTFESTARGHRHVQAVGLIVSSSPRSVSFLTNEVVVQFSSGESGAVAKNALPYELTRLPWAEDRYVARAPAGEDSLLVLDQINKLAAETVGIQWATPNLFHTVEDHTFPPQGAAGAVFGAQPHHALVQTVDAWAAGSTGLNTVIAIVDSGCDANHPDLRNKIQFKHDFLHNTPGQLLPGFHGTCCAGLAAGAVNANDGFSGIAPDADLVVVARPNSDDVNLARLFFWLAGVDAFNQQPAPLPFPIDVISCSWAVDVGELAEDIEKALQRLEANGTVVAFSAGNGVNEEFYADGDGRLASYETVIAVGSSSTLAADEHVCSDSRFGAALDLVAPGGGDDEAADGRTAAPSPLAEPRLTSASTGAPIPYRKFYQTSCACPQVAGVAALVRSANRALSAAQVRQILFDTADHIGEPTEYETGRSKHYGYGQVNAKRAVEAALNQQTTSTAAPPFSTASNTALAADAGP